MSAKNLAALDIGTNSFHLIVVKIKEDGSFEIIDRVKEVIRLGSGKGGALKNITDESSVNAIKAIQYFKGIAQSHNAEIRAVATSAVREAENKEEFIELIKMQTGVEIEIISGFEEARLIYLGVLKAVPVFDNKCLCVDIGGGSTEFIVGTKGETLYVNSLKLGAVRLSQKFFPDYNITKERIKECREWIEGEIYPVMQRIKNIGFDTVVGSSGTIQNAAMMILNYKNLKQSGSPILNNFSFTVDELEIVTSNVLKKKNPGERLKIKGLEEKRADIIPAGLLILKIIFEMFNVKKMIVSGYALREGIIIDAINKSGISGVYTNIRKNSVKQLSESCNYDRKHCSNVACLSLKLFDELKSLHNLSDEYKEYLEAAAILHDIGYHISHSQHHKHSYYIIRNSELLGFTENEIEIIANTARYHRKSHPKAKHTDYQKLPSVHKDAVKKLSALLRIADGLDRTHTGNIVEIQPHLKNGLVIFEVIYTKHFPEIEIWGAERRKELFEEVFNLSVKFNPVKQ